MKTKYFELTLSDDYKQYVTESELAEMIEDCMRFDGIIPFSRKEISKSEYDANRQEVVMSREEKLFNYKPVTVWKRFDEKKEIWKHNHIEDGHVTGEVPTPKTVEQAESWKSAYWWKQFGEIDNTGTVRILDPTGGSE